MTDNNLENQNPNQRVCDRLSLSRKILFELENGSILTGKTEDISPRGVLMKTDARSESELLGIAGMLFIISDDGHFSIGYPCKVVRQKDSAIALEIDKGAAAAFGHYMAEDLLGR